MDEIVRQVAERAGIPEDRARMAVEVVMGQLEKRLPGPIAAQVRQHLAGGGAGGAGGGLGDVAKGLGGLMGR